uniref:Substance P n=2 Tax=Scyliorhinus TaxID=7829 RepID=TKNA_SCYCA|nr:RecName: Full=Substance P [Scyliorhinus canicula]AAB27178.1 substance-P-related peptide [Scyliorhinus canicula=european common dogfish, brain, Peptide, 11 aa] [Scyliorhinus canicula]
KPRPGQFFGLM